MIRKRRNTSPLAQPTSVRAFHTSPTTDDFYDPIDAIKSANKKRRFLFPFKAIGHLLITTLAYFVSFYRIEYPDVIVFDEVHFGKFAGFYLRQSYYFDVHPPLGKMMFAAAGYLLGYRAHFDFANIGESYIENNVPYVGLRALPASLNVLSVALVYAIMKQSGYSTLVCVLSSCMYLFDNAIVAQHRLILLDSSLIFFMLCSVYAYIRFRKLRQRPFSFGWWKWLFATGICLALTVSVKMVGLFVIGTVGLAVALDLWDLLDSRRGLSLKTFSMHFAARTTGLIVVPVAVYLFWFYVHFAILNQSGPGDVYMSPDFQVTLKDSPISVNTLQIHYYDSITLAHESTGGYLHSHELNYPLRYEDGRISSKGQQVTAIQEPDSNSYWQILPTIDIPEGKRRAVRHGDTIQLLHLGTKRYLLTHNVASPSKRTNQEVTTVAPNERYNETLFKVFLKDSSNGNIWKTYMKSAKLIHKATSVALWTSAHKLPDWGLGHQEVNGNKRTNDPTNYWMPMDIMGVNATEVNMKKKEEQQQQQTKMSFLRKFIELQLLMLERNSKILKPHPYSSKPYEWPHMLRGISYWQNKQDREQIYMTGNIFGWRFMLTIIVCFTACLAVEALAQRRGTSLFQAPLRQRLVRSGGFFWLLWCFHYLPFFVMGRNLFLHHYLPAVACGYLLLGAVFQFVFIGDVTLTAKVPIIAYVGGAIIIGLQLAIFILLAPTTYGSPGLSVEQLMFRKLLGTWDLAFL